MKFSKTSIIALMVVISATFVACKSDDPALTVQVRVNNVVFDNGDDFNGDVDGDFTGNGGSATRMFVWQNSLTTADYNADITATSEGMFRMEVTDTDGTTVLNRTLTGGGDPDSFSGVTSAGTPGLWTVIITLTSFDGDGSFSLSEGN